MNKAIFLDRDGTINEDIGDLYLAEKLIFISQAIEALQLLQESFCFLSLQINQELEKACLAGRSILDLMIIL